MVRMWIHLEKLMASHCSVELEESILPSTIGCSPLPIAKSIDMPKRFFCPEWPRGNSLLRQFGMTSKPLMDQPLEDKSTSSTGGFPVKTSALQALAQAWTASEAAYFSRSHAWPLKSSPLFYSLKMCPLLPREDSTELPKPLPRSGMIVAGKLYPLRRLERSTVETVGFYWPTPTARDHKDNGSKSEYRRKSPPLTAMALLPTPTARAAPDCPAERRRDSPSLECVANMQQSTSGKRLCPRFVELLMGYRTGHTELNPLGTQWFHSKLKNHLKN